MCFNPLSLMMVAGTGLNAIGSIMQGQTAYDAAKAQNAAYAEQAGAEREATALEVSQKRYQAGLARGAAIASVGASGAGLEGSPTAVIAADAGERELDIEAIRYGSQVRQTQLRNQGALTLWQGKQARTASFINAGSQIFSGAVGLYDRGVRFSNPFARRIDDGSYRMASRYG